MISAEQWRQCALECIQGAGRYGVGLTDAFQKIVDLASVPDPDEAVMIAGMMQFGADMAKASVDFAAVMAKYQTMAELDDTETLERMMKGL